MGAGVRIIVEELEPFDEVERAHRADVLAWIDAGGPIYRTAKPATPPQHLVAYCLLVDPDLGRALLIDHRLSGLWLPAGGHVEVGEDPAETAAREFAEELDTAAVFLAGWEAKPFFITVTETESVARTEQHTDVSLWYAFAGSALEVVTADEREAVSCHWWPFDQIRFSELSRFDPHLPRAVIKLVASLAWTSA